MKCSRCGTKLRKKDRFCPNCGTPVILLPDQEDADFDDHTFRDSFLEKDEDRGHALMVTSVLLLLIAVSAFCVLGYFYYKETGSLPFLEGDGQAVVKQEEGSSRIPSPIAQTLALIDEMETENGSLVPTTEAPQRETKTEKSTEKATEAPRGVVIDEAKLTSIMNESTADSYGVFVTDLRSMDTWTAGNAEDAMYASALISVPILYTAAYELDAGTITLNDPIRYVNSIGGRGEANPEEKVGKDYALSYYLTTMLTYSDNNCMNCLIDYLGIDTINRVCQSAGFTSVDMQRKIVEDVTDGTENYISARDLTMMVRELYNGKFHTIGRDFIVKYFHIDDNDSNRTVAGNAPSLAPEAVFLNQNGRGDTRYNEVAVVTNGTHAFVISFMLNGASGFTFESAVQDATDYVFQRFEEDNR